MSWFAIAKKVEEWFSYRDEVRTLWRSAIKFEQERCGIHFDLENDDSVDTREVELGGDGDSKNRVVACLCIAGGDWESPVAYFRCQSETKYGKGGTWSPQLKFVIIPEKGNPNLVKGKRGLVPKDSGDGDKVDDASKKELWKELEHLAEERIESYDKALSDDSDMCDVGAFRDLVVPYGKAMRKKASGGTNIERFLEQISQMVTNKNPGFAYATSMEYFLKNGKPYPSEPMTPDEMARIKFAIDRVKTFKMKQCFYNSQYLATGNPRLRYVEGYVLTDRIPFPIEHGWNTLNGKVIDFTLRHANGGKSILGEIPAGWEYFGVELPTSMVHSLWSKHGVAMPLVTNYLDGFPLLREDGKPSVVRKQKKDGPDAVPKTEEVAKEPAVSGEGDDP